MWGEVEGATSRAKEATFGVEEDEMVGRVGGRRNKRLEVNGVERFPT